MLVIYFKIFWTWEHFSKNILSYKILLLFLALLNFENYISRKNENFEEITEWMMIELQGDLESRTQDTMKNKFVGDFHFTKDASKNNFFK